MTVSAALQWGEQQLRAEHTGVPRLTAEVLLSHLLGRERAYLYGHPERMLSEAEREQFERSIEARRRGRPTQYITGVQEFYGRLFRVTPDVMIPRPETEHLIEAILARGLLDGAPGRLRAVDAGTGSGAIAVTLALETGAGMLATDVSAGALRVAAGNSRRLNAAVHFVHCDLLTGIADGSMDLVASNPPYVPRADERSLQREVRDHEPHLALFGGANGLDFYRRLTRESPRVLRPGGWLVLELGIRQLEPVRAMLDGRWSQIRVGEDLAGLPRVLSTRYRP